MKVHIICCNDSVEYAVIGSQSKVEEKRETLAEKDWCLHYSRTFTYEEYRNRFYWHIHIVEGESHDYDPQA